MACREALPPGVAQPSRVWCADLFPPMIADTHPIVEILITGKQLYIDDDDDDGMPQQVGWHALLSWTRNAVPVKHNKEKRLRRYI